MNPAGHLLSQLLNARTATAAVMPGQRLTQSQAPRPPQIYSPGPLTLFLLKGKFSAKSQQGPLTLSIGRRKEISAGSTAAGRFVASAPLALACSGLSSHSASSDWKEKGKELTHGNNCQQGKESGFLNALRSQLHAERAAPAQNREHCKRCRRYLNMSVSSYRVGPAPVCASPSRACPGLDSKGKCDAQPPLTSSTAKTLPLTDLEMSRTAERSQGFHDLWPHTPKLNTRNT